MLMARPGLLTAAFPKAAVLSVASAWAGGTPARERGREGERGCIHGKQRRCAHAPD